MNGLLLDVRYALRLLRDLLRDDLGLQEVVQRKQ